MLTIYFPFVTSQEESVWKLFLTLLNNNEYLKYSLCRTNNKGLAITTGQIHCKPWSIAHTVKLHWYLYQAKIHISRNKFVRCYFWAVCLDHKPRSHSWEISLLWDFQIVTQKYSFSPYKPGFKVFIKWNKNNLNLTIYDVIRCHLSRS